MWTFVETVYFAVPQITDIICQDLELSETDNFLQRGLHSIIAMSDWNLLNNEY